MSTKVANNVDAPLLTIPEVAELLGISRERCYQLAAAGTIPSVRLSPRRIRVPRAALDDWIAARVEHARTGGS